MTEAERIARGLTEAQREAILEAHCSVPSRYEEWTPDCVCSLNDWARQLGLTEARLRWPNGVVFSSLGLAVRHHLLTKKRDDDDRS